MTLPLFVQWFKLHRDLFSQVPNAHMIFVAPMQWAEAVSSLASWGSRHSPTAALTQLICISPQFAAWVAWHNLIAAFDAFAVDDTVCPIAFAQPLQPHVRVWDSVSLVTLQVIGLGTFERGVGCLDFSKAVRQMLILEFNWFVWPFWMWLPCWPALVLKLR